MFFKCAEILNGVLWKVVSSIHHGFSSAFTKHVFFTGSQCVNSCSCSVTLLGKVCEKWRVNSLFTQQRYLSEDVVGIFFKCKMIASADVAGFLCLITLSRWLLSMLKQIISPPWLGADYLFWLGRILCPDLGTGHVKVCLVFMLSITCHTYIDIQHTFNIRDTVQAIGGVHATGTGTWFNRISYLTLKSHLVKHFCWGNREKLTVSFHPFL